MKTVFVRTAIVAAAGLFGIGAAANGAPPARSTGPSATAPSSTVVRDGPAYRLGNPDAPVTLTEYVSYTCPHCAHFARDGDPALLTGYIPGGKLAVEIRPFIRNQADLAAALLAMCGTPGDFPGAHEALMLSQSAWLPRLEKATPGQRERWRTGTPAAQRQAVARDAGFYEMFRARGMSTRQIDTCLADDEAARTLAAATQDYMKNPGVRGTPSFAIGGVLLAGTHDWPSLEPQLELRLPAAARSSGRR